MAKTITVMNRGSRRFKVGNETDIAKAKFLEPGETMALPEAEAKNLLAYKDIADVGKMVKMPDVSELQAKNAELLKKITKLEEELKDLLKKLEKKEKRNKEEPK